MSDVPRDAPRSPHWPYSEKELYDLADHLTEELVAQVLGMQRPVATEADLEALAGLLADHVLFAYKLVERPNGFRPTDDG